MHDAKSAAVESLSRVDVLKRLGHLENDGDSLGPCDAKSELIRTMLRFGDGSTFDEFDDGVGLTFVADHGLHDLRDARVVELRLDAELV